MPDKLDRTASDGALMDVQAVAEAWGTSRRFVEKMIATGELPAFRIGKRMVRVRRADVDAVLRRIPTVSAAGGAS